ELPQHQLARSRMVFRVAHPVAQEIIEIRDRWKLGRRAEAAVLVIGCVLEVAVGMIEDRSSARSRSVGLSQAVERSNDSAPGSLDVRALLDPRLVDARQQFHQAGPPAQRARREVRAAEERLETRRE